MSNKGFGCGRFTLNFADKTIVGSKASFDKAGKGYGPIYDELVALMEKHPDFGCKVKAPKKRSDKPKRSYEGMDIAFIQDFFHATGREAEAEALKKALDYAEKNSISKYPIAKRMLFDAVPNFNYESAKDKVAEYRHKRLLTLSGAEAVKEAVSAQSNEPDLAAKKAA